MRTTLTFSAGALIASLSLTSFGSAQQATRETLSTAEYPPGFDTIVATSRMPAGVCFDRHIHYGMETQYVLEGELVLHIDGQSDRRLTAGSAAQIPSGVPHGGCAVGATKSLVVLIVEKGKPIVSAP